jgi:hypothetical protein
LLLLLLLLVVVVLLCDRKPWQARLLVLTWISGILYLMVLYQGCVLWLSQWKPAAEPNK